MFVHTKMIPQDPEPGAAGGGAPATPAPASAPTPAAAPVGTQGAAPAATPAAQPAAPSQPAVRENIYDRYFKNFGQAPAAPAASSGDPEADAAARGAEALVSELTQMREAIVSMRASGQPQAAAAVEQKVKTFIEHLQAGDPVGAEAAMRAKLEAEILPRAVSEATRKAIQVSNAQNELSSFGQVLLRDNPDLAPVQDIIEQNAQYLVQQARQARMIPDGDLNAYVNAYKSALRQSVQRFREFGRGSAAAGAVNANERTQQVLAASTIPPSASGQNPQASPAGGNGERVLTRSFDEQKSADSAWLASRRARKLQLQGMQG